MPRLGTVDAEIEVPPAENRELSRVLPFTFTHAADLNVALYASPAVGYSVFLISFQPGSFNFMFFPLSRVKQKVTCVNGYEQHIGLLLTT